MVRSRDPRFAQAKRHRRPTDRHKQDYKKKAPRWFTAADFDYDATTGRMTCPAGQRMNTSGESILTTSGYQAMSFKAPAAACRGCKLRTQCLKNPAQKSPRQVRIFFERQKGSLTEAMKIKIDTPEGRKIYSKRLGNVEPVFANIRAHKSLDRFTLRGQSKVNVQWKLYCLVHNLEKLGKYGTGRN